MQAGRAVGGQVHGRAGGWVGGWRWMGGGGLWVGCGCCAWATGCGQAGDVVHGGAADNSWDKAGAVGWQGRAWWQSRGYRIHCSRLPSEQAREEEAAEGERKAQHAKHSACLPEAARRAAVDGGLPSGAAAIAGAGEERGKGALGAAKQAPAAAGERVGGQAWHG